MAFDYPTDINFSAPLLPYAGPEYDRMYFDQHNEVLRLYFNQLDDAARYGIAQEYSQSVAWFMS